MFLAGGAVINEVVFDVDDPGAFCNLSRDVKDRCLHFGSSFESGNLRQAVQVQETRFCVRNLPVITS